jgi:ankyrin repeat protein
MRTQTLMAALAAVLLSSLGVSAAGTSLADAIKSGNREAIRTLVRNPADVNAVAVDGTTALHWAVRANDLETTDLLIRAGAKVSVMSRYGVTPLSLAALNANAAIVERLLKAGADANSKSPEAETVLMEASRSGKTAVVRLLLQHHADVDAREGWLGQTALMWAAAENHGDVVGMLLEAGASANTASRIFADHELKPGDFGTPKAPTSKGGMTALHFAAREGAIDAVRMLAAKGADLDQVDPDGVNALLYASINGHTDVAALLLEKGANPNIADTFGRTVLYQTIDLNNMEAVSPRPAPKVNGKTTPLALTKLAIAKGAALNPQIIGPLPPRSTQGNNDTTPIGATPLWRAAKSSDVEATKLLLAAGADPLVPSRDGVTPLMVAAGQEWKVDWSRGTEPESVETVKVLLASGVDINQRNNRAETALHGAADRGADLVVAYLVEHGASLDAKDKSNRTALDMAMGVPPVTGRNPFEYRDKYGADSTAALLRKLMAEKGVAIEPYVKPGDAKAPAAPAGQ